jgi:hypothetical protein
MKRAIPLFLALAVLVSGCGNGLKPGLFGRTPAPPATEPDEPVLTPELSAPPPPAGAVTVEALDTTTEAQRAAATATPAPEGDAALGKVVVSLGDVTQAGFWLRSPLVAAARPGLVKTAGGQTVQVDLLPGEGAAQLSLAAFRALGLGLTDLPEVTVYGR